MVITTSSEEEGQNPLAIVQRNVTDVPATKPVIVVVGDDGVVIVAVPDTTVQVPLPVVDVFPSNAYEVALQRVVSAPALATVGSSSTVITISSVDETHVPLFIVQRSVAEFPITNPVIVVVGELMEVIVAVPDTMVHVPVPTPAELADITVDVTLQRFSSGPASATVGRLSIVIVISSAEAGQNPLEMVHLSVTEVPAINPVIVEFAELGVVIVAVPDTIVHKPLPTIGEFPASVYEVTLQRLVSAPASATVGGLSTLITISSVLLEQPGAEMVHLRVAVAPMVNPLTADVGDVGVVIVAVPDTTDQTPVPEAGALPLSVVLVILHKFWSDPAAAAVMVLLILITTVSVEAVQGELLMVHTKVTEVPAVKPVTVEVGDEGVVMVAVPETIDHTPVPKAGAFADKLADPELHKF